MMGFISVKEASEKWGITERVVRQYCADGRVPGALKDLEYSRKCQKAGKKTPPASGSGRPNGQTYSGKG